MDRIPASEVGGVGSIPTEGTKHEANKMMQEKIKFKAHIIKDLIIVIVSVVFAVYLAKTGAVYWIIGRSQEIRIIGTFVSGMLFSYAFSVAPAGVALVQIARASSIFWTAFFGALGSVAGDMIIYRFVRDRVSEDFAYLLDLAPAHRIKAIFHKRMFRWVIPFLGALLIATPLPNEIGVTLLGLSKMKSRYFLLLSFSLNFIGILFLVWVAR